MINSIDTHSIREFTRMPHLYQGNRLIALYNLIQSEGYPLVFSQAHPFNHLKALQFSDTKIIAIRRIEPTDSFFPCRLETLIFLKTDFELISE